MQAQVALVALLCFIAAIRFRGARGVRCPKRFEPWRCFLLRAGFKIRIRAWLILRAFIAVCADIRGSSSFRGSGVTVFAAWKIPEEFGFG
jgi:hypothetical protein